ncbi:MAG TPA: DUF6159 family protein [Bryobacteraceae bacterium]|nr:DUF6159 family protein [Bryobacteraceae bacterium]
MGRFSRTWQLFQESFAVLSGDSEILIFPVLSGTSLLLLAASFLIPLYRDGTIVAVVRHKGTWDDYAVLFAWYYLNFLVGIFFNSALMACANMRLAGKQPTIGAGFDMAMRRIGPIALWAFIAASVGLALSTLRDRRNKPLSLVVAGLSLAWSLITYLMVPVLLFENQGVFRALHRSEQLFRRHWGEQVAGSFGFGLLTTVLSIPAVLLALAFWRPDPMAGIILAAVYLLILSIVTSAVKGIFTVALYRYAVAGTAPAGFSADVIDGALGGRKRKEELPPWEQY